MKRKNIKILVVVLTAAMLVGCGNTGNTSTKNESGSVKNETIENTSVDETITHEITEEPTPTEESTSNLESTETPAEQFEFYIIDYLTDAEVVETVFSISEEGRPCVNVTHADGTTQYHEVYEEQGEILWSAVVRGENEGIWGGDYKIPTKESTEMPTPTEEPTEPPTQETVHKHSYSESIITEALCNTTGVKRYSCSCGDSYEEEYINTWNHKSDGVRVTDKEPTCTESGQTYEHCIYCGTWMYPEQGAPALGHTPDSYWIYHHGTGTYRLGCANCGVLLEERNDEPEGVEIRDFYPRDGLEIIDPFPR